MPATKRFASQPQVPLPGSEKQPAVPTSEPIGGLAPPPKASSAALTVSVVLSPKAKLDPKTLLKPGGRLTRAEYAKRHGPAPASIKLLKAFAKEFGFRVEQAPGQARRTFYVSGSTAAMQKAFGVSLSTATIEGVKYRVRHGTICLPEELTGHVLAVLGFDNRPQAQPHFRVHKRAATGTAYTPLQVAELYGFPASVSAAGQTIGIIELGGGYRSADLKAYFKSLGQSAPKVTAVKVDKATNSPGKADGADGEVMLDIEIAGAVAPGAHIVVYFAPNTDQGFIDAIAQAVHDTTHKPSVISISWGAPESSWTAQSLTTLDAACQAAAALGITVLVAAGDNGSSDGVTDSANHVDFPASSPHVLACGGTKLIGSGSTITSEVVWNETEAKEGATGGGVSNVFPLPSWQSRSNVPASTSATGGRGVPDVSGDADPSTGYTVRVDGETFPVGGTSAVAPLWAGLIALANAQNKATAGFLNPVLYASGSSKAFRDIVAGDNGAFSAGPGWDACTGLGSPVGTAIAQVLASAAASNRAKKAAGTGMKRPAKKATRAVAKVRSKGSAQA